VSSAAVFGIVLLKPALVLVVASAITAVLRRSTAAARHAVWIGAVLAVLLLPAWRVVLPPVRIPVDWTALKQAVPVLAGPNLPGFPGSKAGNGAAVSGTLPHTGNPALTASGPQGWGDQLVLALSGIWLLGLLVCGSRRVVAEIRTRRIIRDSRPHHNPRLDALVAEVSRAAGVGGVEVRLSGATASPAVAGILRPVVLLPESARAWHRTDLRAVLVHEFAHIRRRDPLTNALGDLVTVLYWCNPLVRFAVRRMRVEGETACDDRVLLSGTDPGRYASLLLDVARAASQAGGVPRAATAMARPRELESRLLAVLDDRIRRRSVPTWMSGALAGAALLVAVPTAALTLRDADIPRFIQLRAPEPDRLGDSLANPSSERLPVSATAAQISRAASQALAGPDAHLARMLFSALAHEPSDPADLIRERATWALLQVEEGRLIEPLMLALGAADWRVQSYAAWALAPSRDPRAIPALLPLLAHPVWRLRAMAAAALRVSGSPEAAGRMRAALADPAWQVRVEAVEYFVALGGPSLENTLQPLLNDRHIAVRHAAADGLSRFALTPTP